MRGSARPNGRPFGRSKLRSYFSPFHQIKCVRAGVVTGHFGHKTLRHQDTLGHFGTDLKTLRHQKLGTRHFDTSAVIEEKPGHSDPAQFR